MFLRFLLLLLPDIQSIWPNKLCTYLAIYVPSCLSYLSLLLSMSQSIHIGIPSTHCNLHLYFGAYRSKRLPTHRFVLAIFKHFYINLHLESSMIHDCIFLAPLAYHLARIDSRLSLLKRSTPPKCL